MRRTPKPQLFKNEKGEDVVLCFGADFCAEHEWGIKEIHESFGIPLKATSSLFGIQAKTITQLPDEGVLFLSDKDKAALVFDPYLNWRKGKGERVSWNDLSTELKGQEKTLHAAWDGKSFGVVGYNEDATFLQQLHQAILNKDAAIWLGGGGVFQNAGLCIGIVSLIPEENKTTMATADLDRLHIQKVVDDIGIIARLEKAKCKFYACSPRWVSESEEKKTEHCVMFWLNPIDQKNDNYGWFTVEELDQWIKGTGPIPKVGRLEILIKDGRTVDASRKKF